MQQSSKACRLTPSTAAGIATLVVRGPAAETLILSLAHLNTKTLKRDYIYYGTWPIGTTERSETALAEQVVVCRVSDDEIEISCHGGVAVSNAILDSLAVADCQIVDPDQWDSRHNDLVAQEAEVELVKCTTAKTACHLLDQLNGALVNNLKEIRSLIGHPSTQESVDVLERLETLEQRYAFGSRLAQGWKVVLAGPPNVGKSSLMNAIVGHDRAIVHPTAGTTRDWIESHTVVGGWPIRLTDTAGIRETHDPIESAGVERSRLQLSQADLVMLVVAADEGWTPTHQALLSQTKVECFVCVSKVDLDPAGSASLAQKIESEFGVPQALPKCVLASSQTQPGIDDVLRTIEARLFASAPEAGAALPFLERHVGLIRTAINRWQAGEYKQTVAALAQLIHGHNEQSL